MRCCGFTKLHLQGAHFNVVPNTFGIVVGATPYGCSNIIMSTYTTTSDDLHVYIHQHLDLKKTFHNISFCKYFFYDSVV